MFAALAPTWFVNADDPKIRSLADQIVVGAGGDREQAIRLFYTVRDGIRYSAYNISLEPESFRATAVLAAGSSWCVPKSVLLAALCRAVGIPCRLGYADVKNHMATKRLIEAMGTDVFYYHGYNEILLDGRWVKATVAFNRSLCEKARLAPLDFDGVHDSLYHPFDLDGNRYMEYLHDYGAFDDVPHQALVDCFAVRYPRIHGRDEVLQGGDFETEVAQETAAQDARDRR